MRWPVSLLLLAACAHGDTRAEPRPVATPAAPAITREAMLNILLRRCGECHQGSRASAVPEALAVFDLDLPDWPRRFDAQRFQVALQRLGDDPASDRAAFIAFHHGLDAERLRAR